MISALLVATVQACPSGFQGSYSSQCTYRSWDHSQPASSWYEAGAGCARMNSELLSFKTTSGIEAHQLPEWEKGDELKVWVGARKDTVQGGWVWGDGRAVDVGLLAGHGVVFASGSYPSTHTCLVLQDIDRRITLTPADCSEKHHHMCGTTPYCPFHLLADMKFTAKLSSYATEVVVRGDGVLVAGGRDVGLGDWETPNRYVVESPAGFECKWTAEFSIDEKTKVVSVRSGCGVLEHSPVFDIDCTQVTSVPGKDKTVFGFTTDAPPSTESPAGKRGSVNILPAERATAQSDSDTIPTWLWPAAFGGVALISAVLSIGAYRRRPSSSDEEGEARKKKRPLPKKDYIHDPNAALHCPTCQRFNGNESQERLKKVHGAMQNEFMQPLKVLSTSCEHSGADHIHHFTVENDYDAPCLGALSTVYSRTKPRLPRNTRIHIEKQTYQKRCDSEDYDQEYGAGYF